MTVDRIAEIEAKVAAGRRADKARGKPSSLVLDDLEFLLAELAAVRELAEERLDAIEQWEKADAELRVVREHADTLEAAVAKVADWLRKVADGHEVDSALYASPAVRDQIAIAVKTYRMAADDLAAALPSRKTM
jgi:hypothetical protein